jgi:catechol 2,3-dioxygenase-like lactoylglutathione lyase family enzyme
VVFDIDGETGACPRDKVKRIVSSVRVRRDPKETCMSHCLPHHLDLTVSDLSRSMLFYDKVLGGLGYTRSEEYAGEVPCWVIGEGSGVFSIGLHLARSERSHDRYAAGLHHLAFHAASRADVDAFHDLLMGEGIEVLDAPAEYDYVPGYYAVFFADPDGIKLELVHEPRIDARPPPDEETAP